VNRGWNTAPNPRSTLRSHMPNLLVLSLAALNAPHRKAFDLLAQDFGWRVDLCASAELPIESEWGTRAYDHLTNERSFGGLAVRLRTLRARLKAATSQGRSRQP